MGEEYNALPDMLREILGGEQLESIMQSIKSEAPQEPKQEADSAPASAPAMPEMPAISPEMLAKLPGVISALAGSQADADKITEKLPQVMQALGASNAAKGENKEAKRDSSPISRIMGGDAQRRALLKALRPYMSDRRKGIIDNVMRFGSMAEIMSTLMDTSH